MKAKPPLECARGRGPAAAATGHRLVARTVVVLFAALSLGLAASAVLAAAGDGEPRISDGVVKIGLLLDMAGPYAATTGIGSVTAAQMAAEDFGGRVLGAPIEIVTADPQNNPDRAAAIAREWFGAGHVDAILDVAGSSAALIVQAIATTRHKIVSLSAPGAVRLTNEACSPTAIHYAYDTYAIAHTLGEALVQRGYDSWFFITVDYSFGYDLEGDTAEVVTENGGKVLGRARHPLDTADFTSYLAQAEQSEAKVIGLANGGADTINAIKDAARRRMIPGPQLFAALALRLNGVDNLGLATAQGMFLGEAFYWDMNEATRAWSKRFFARLHRMPNGLQAALYSSTMHYLKAVASAGTDATEPVMQAMRAAPIDDFFAQGGHIRADGLMVHDMYLFQVKEPSQSQYPWDYYRLVATVPGARAFMPLAQSKCPLVKK